MKPGHELDPKRDEADRLLGKANLLRMKGEFAEAGSLVQQAVELIPDYAPAWEMLGDLKMSSGDRAAAQEAYKQAHELDPKLVSSERKYAELVLAITNERLQQEEWSRMLEGSEGDLLQMKRNPGLAFLCSMCVPGVGQLYNGEFVKGGIVLGLFVVGWIVIFAMPEGNLFMKNLLKMLFSANPARGGLSPLLTMTFFALLLTHLYALIDAPLSAFRRNRAAGFE